MFFFADRFDLFETRVQVLRDELKTSEESFFELAQRRRFFAELRVKYFFEVDARGDGVFEIRQKFDVVRAIGGRNGSAESRDCGIDLRERFLQCVRIFHREVFEVAGAFPVDVGITLVGRLPGDRQRDLLQLER